MSRCLSSWLTRGGLFGRNMRAGFDRLQTRTLQAMTQRYILVNAQRCLFVLQFVSRTNFDNLDDVIMSSSKCPIATGMFLEPERRVLARESHNMVDSEKAGRGLLRAHEVD
jgi:hypothetical protein